MTEQAYLADLNAIIWQWYEIIARREEDLSSFRRKYEQLSKAYLQAVLSLWPAVIGRVEEMNSRRASISDSPFTLGLGIAYTSPPHLLLPRSFNQVHEEALKRFLLKTFLYGMLAFFSTSSCHPHSASEPELHVLCERFLREEQDGSQDGKDPSSDSQMVEFHRRLFMYYYEIDLGPALRYQMDLGGWKRLLNYNFFRQHYCSGLRLSSRWNNLSD